jgi:octaprenyl-diphosphate synthase
MGLMQRAMEALDSIQSGQTPDTKKPSDHALDGLKALVHADMQAVNDVILVQLDCEEPLIRTVGEHIMKAGGKRLRPSLTLVSAKLCGYADGNRHIDLAAAVELIHTATLLHDDVVDESHLRRGLATANDLWGNKASVLVGDFLLSRAFQLMVKDGSLKVLKILSDVSAIISQGEVMQLAIAGAPDTPEESYFKVIEAKTAALFAAGCEIGAVVAGTEDQEAALRDFGMKLGIAFQIMDDALDYAAEQAKLGKTVGDDFREGKITLPVILAYQDGTQEERDFWHRCMQDQEQTDADLPHALEIISKHQGIERSIQRAEQIVEEAKAALSAFPASPAKDALFAVADFSVARAH